MFLWQIPRCAVKPGSQLSITPDFVILLLTECIFLEPGFWDP